MKLSADKLERLAILAEECAEVQHIIMKTIRHGENETHPDDLETTNKTILSQEIGDLLFAVTWCIEEEDINEIVVETVFRHRHESISKYLHYNTIEIEDEDE